MSDWDKMDGKGRQDHQKVAAGSLFLMIFWLVTVWDVWYRSSVKV